MFGYEPQPLVWGNEGAKIAHISQAPSRKVHDTGIPFNDISGKRLRSWYGIHPDQFYNKDFFYITAISHCFPGKSKNGGDQEPPAACADSWLREELSYLDNDIFLIVGSYAAQYLFPKQKLAGLIFNDQELMGKPTYVLPHPSPLNIKWLKDHPGFLQERLPFIKEVIHACLDR